MIKNIFIGFLLLVIFSCYKNKKYDLVLTNDELVHAMVEMYTVNAAWELNDRSLRDSMSHIYLTKIADNLGHDPELIKKDFDKLLLMPDTLVMIQGRALDTLRILADKAVSRDRITLGLE